MSFVRAGRFIERTHVASYYIYCGTQLFRPLTPPIDTHTSHSRRVCADRFRKMCQSSGYPDNARPGAPYRIPPKGKKVKS